jgi:exopolysaccharide biosynthesis WecB/TagA/CpsF family protein
MNHIFYLKPTTPRRSILGLDVCRFDYSDALAFANEMVTLPIGQTVISFLNANNANLMVEDQLYREILSRQVIFPDGVGIDIASQMIYGKKFPANLNGTDFVPALLTYMCKPKRIGLIGGRPGVAEVAAENFRQHAPWHEFIPVSHGYFSEHEASAVSQHARALNLDILLVAMGSPQQEKWVDKYVAADCARLVLCVGALFDFTSHTFPRAPHLMRKLRIEWLFRLSLEPKRMWRRYILGNPKFLIRAMKQAVLRRAFNRSRPENDGLNIRY